MRLAWGLATLLFIVLLPVTLITGNERWIVNNLSFYQWGYERHFSYQTTGLSKNELDRATQEMITYFNSDQDYPDIKVQAGGRTFQLFDERDQLHLKDVKDLIQLTFFIQAVSLAYVILFSVAAVLARRNRRPLANLAKPWLWGGVFTVCLLVAVGLALMLDFESIFLQFHLMSFSNDLWVLDPATSYLIRMVPEGFFMDLALLVAGLALVEGLALAVLAGAVLAWQKRDARSLVGAR